MILTSSLREHLWSDSVLELKQLTFTLEVNSGMSKSSFKELSMKPTREDSLARMLAEVDMTSMFMYNLVLELTFVEKNQL